MKKAILKRVVAGALVLSAGTTGMSAAAGASPAQPGDLLCRTNVWTPVYSPNTWMPKYWIAPGHDMRVHVNRNAGIWFYGHTAEHGDDGWANSTQFAYCR